MKKLTLLIISVSLLIFTACSDLSGTPEEDSDSDLDLTLATESLDLPAEPFNYSNPDLPGFFNRPEITREDNEPASNLTTDWGATLGRVLFYDTNLSANNTISCSSCHVQENAFSDPEVLSEGFEGELTGRNSMGLSNARFYENGHFFWDERASTLEEQVLMPIQDDVEMGLTLDELETKIENQSYYSYLFNQVFGDEEVTSERISLALSQFVRSMLSYQSRFDEGTVQVNDIAQDDFPNFTDQENLGKRVFFDVNLGACAGCHRTELFIGDEPANNGLDATTTDEGLAVVSGNMRDEGKFKVPSLRNIELTTPYMHDGRFANLEEVVEHYNSGIENHPNLDNRLRRPNGNPRRLNLSNTEKEALVAFLKTLTDPEFITDEKFSDPFISQSQ